jgi:hypothetical protein
MYGRDIGIRAIWIGDDWVRKRKKGEKLTPTDVMESAAAIAAAAECAFLLFFGGRVLLELDGWDGQLVGGIA